MYNYPHIKLGSIYTRFESVNGLSPLTETSPCSHDNNIIQTTKSNISRKWQATLAKVIPFYNAFLNIKRLKILLLNHTNTAGAHKGTSVHRQLRALAAPRKYYPGINNSLNRQGLIYSTRDSTKVKFVKHNANV